MEVGKKAKWLYPVVAATIALSYMPLRDRLTGQEPLERVTVSNITFNLLLTFFIFGVSASWIADRIWPRGPRWKSWAVLSVLMVGLIYWMTLWGYETRI